MTMHRIARLLAVLAVLIQPAHALDLQSTKVPGRTVPSLSDGEIAINRVDKNLFFRNVDGTIGRGALMDATPAGRAAVETGLASGLSVIAKAVGAIPRSLDLRAVDVINVADYANPGEAELVGDGTHDATSAIVRAINAATARRVLTDSYGGAGPGICFPGGNYLNTGFDIPGWRFSIQPCSGNWGTVTLTLKNGSNRSVIRSTALAAGSTQSNYNFPVIDGIIINGNRAKQTGTSHCIEFADDPTAVFKEYHRAGVLTNVHALECKSAGVYTGFNRNGLEATNLWSEWNASSLVLNGYDNQIMLGGMGHSSGPVVDFRFGGSSSFVNVNLYGGNTGIRVLPFVNNYLYFIGGSIDGNYQGAAQIWNEGSPADMSAPLLAADDWAYYTKLSRDWTESTPQVWVASTAYTVGQRRLAGQEMYEVIQAGTSAASGNGPSGRTASITDGTTKWKWVLSSQARQMLFSNTIFAANSGLGDGAFPALLLKNGASATLTGMSFATNAAASGNAQPYKNRNNYLVEQSGGSGLGKVYWAASNQFVIGQTGDPAYTIAMFNRPEGVVGLVEEGDGSATSYSPRTRFGNSTATNNTVSVNGAAGSSRAIRYETAGVGRIIFGATGDIENGSNAGTNFGVQTLNDAGGFLRQDALLDRASGTWKFGGSAFFGLNGSLYTSLFVNGGGSTSRAFSVATDGSIRWQWGGTGGEASGNVGTDMQLDAFANDSSYLFTVMRATRATGNVTFFKPVAVQAPLSGQLLVLSGAPTTANIPSGSWSGIKRTDTGYVGMCANDNGTIKCAAGWN